MERVVKWEKDRVSTPGPGREGTWSLPPGHGEIHDRAARTAEWMEAEEIACVPVWE